ncbi:hypothetical protein QM012_005538 [Aureobasidium pullulans]|uniref:Uncharacterized protein n=1 Tax=Aureobasidium pullulans TaxID=5580 RepID=A0ABR0T4L5_AURPU
MCFVEKQIPNCNLCGAVGVPETLWLGCPFSLPWGDCNLIFETTVNIIRGHPTCVSLDQLCREVRMGVVPGTPSAHVHVDPRMDVDPLAPPQYTVATQMLTPPRVALTLPTGWTADNTQISSDALNLATEYRNSLVRMVEDLIPTVSSLNTTIAALDDRLRIVIEWSEGYMTGMIVAANNHITKIEAAEFEIANSTAWSDQAEMDIAIIIDGIINSLRPFESAFVWSRRFNDLFVHLRRMAGELSPPGPATEDAIPIMRRRGAITDLNDATDASRSDFLPPLSFYLPEDAFSDDGEGMDDDIDNFDT